MSATGTQSVTGWSGGADPARNWRSFYKTPVTGIGNLVRKAVPGVTLPVLPPAPDTTPLPQVILDLRDVARLFTEALERLHTARSIVEGYCTPPPDNQQGDNES